VPFYPERRTMDPVDRILLVPRFRGRASSDFYPWLGQRLGALGWRGELEVVSLRTPDQPEVTATVAAVRGRLGAARAGRTVLVGHSVGAQAVLRALAAPGGPAVAGFVLVGAWWTLDHPDAALRPWIDEPFDWTRAAAAAARRIVLLSTDDPHTADVARARRLFDQRLGAEVEVHDGARHFERPEEPAVLAALGGLLGLL
jgi:predicted alpha/beta hydrolase family esterase